MGRIEDIKDFMRNKIERLREAHEEQIRSTYMQKKSDEKQPRYLENIINQEEMDHGE